MLISEYRFNGPGTAGTGNVADEFVEFYNNTPTPVNLAGYRTLQGNPDGTSRIIPLPSFTPTIPARGHLLIINSSKDGYSLIGYSYGADLIASAPDFYFDNQGIALLGQEGNDTVIDAVGFAGNDTRLIEGTPLSSISGAPTLQYSFLRRFVGGRPVDTNNNVADFVIVSTDAAQPVSNVPTLLGAPGPERTTSPVSRLFSSIRIGLLHPGVASSSAPNRVSTPGANGNPGMLEIRRRFTNQSGSTVTRLRFRIVDITTDGTPNEIPGQQQAILRAVSSATITVNTGTADVTTVPLTLEEPPVQPLGGGLNSSFVVGTLAMPRAIADGETVFVNFNLSVIQGGNFRFFVLLESLP